MKKFFSKNNLVTLLFATTVLWTQSGCKTKAAENNRPVSSTEQTLSIPALFERTGELAKATEWQRTKEKVAELKEKLAKESGDVKSRLQLASIYMSEARITGEHPYYYPAILHILDGVLALENKNFEALVYKASVKLSQHQFSEAKQIAEKARVINPANAYIYGVLVDANVELGEYEEAVKMSDRMQGIKPSLESYARVSYLREIYGDYPGAIAAMKMAVQAGLPASEPQCWTRKTLGHLYEETNDWVKAEKEYNEIISMRPSYAFAWEGLARVEKKKGNYSKALDLLNKASMIMPEYSFQEEMADIFDKQGEKEKATSKYREVIKMLKQDEASGHSVSLEMCKIYTKLGEYEAAEEYGKKEFSARPANIDVNNALAWLKYKQGQLENAKDYLKTGIRTGSKDPELLERAKLMSK